MYKRLQKQQEKLDKQNELKKRLENKSYEYLFQSVLFDYLEQKAPYLDENSYESRLSFANLISLYYMFINCRIFSHDQLVCTLISRGETFRNNLNDIKRPSRAQINKQHIKTSAQQNRPQFNTQLSYQNKRNSIDYASPMSAYNHQPASMPPYNLPPHTPLQHQKSTSNTIDPYNAPHSVPTPSKSFSSLVNQAQDDYNTLNNSYDTNKFKAKSYSLRAAKPLSKLAVYVLHFPIPQIPQFQHERNQRFVVLYGFGTKKQEIMDKTYNLTKNLKYLFCRKTAIDLNEPPTPLTSSSSSSKQRTTNNNSLKKHFNTITTLNFALSTSDIDRLTQLNIQYSKMSYYDQYCIMNKLIIHLIDIYKTLDHKNYLPKLQHIQFMFDLMESNLNVFNLLLFVIRLLHVGPLIEQYLKNKFASNLTPSNRICYFEYLSYFYLNIIGVLRLHLLSLVLWKNLALQVFECLFKLVKNIERPSKCSSHEKCSLMLLNEMYMACGYIKAAFPLFEPIANKIRAEKCFIQVPSLV